MMEGMNFAAIDIGTNAARLLIKNIDHNPLGETKFRKVLFIRYPLRLGMDVFSMGKIGKERAECIITRLWKAYPVSLHDSRKGCDICNIKDYCKII